MTRSGLRLRALYLAALVFVAAVSAGVGFVGTTAAANAPDCETVDYAGGDGSRGDPYEISNVDQLQCLGQAGDSGPSDDYELVSNIDASETAEWNGGDGFDPISFDGDISAFAGTLDGNDHSITGLTIDRPSTFSPIGLFASLSGTIENLYLTDVDITGDFDVGTLAGDNTGGTVRNVASVGGTVGGQYTVGGLLGQNGGTVSRSYATTDVTGATTAGGLVGRNTGTIQESYTTGAVTVSTQPVEGSKVGGGLVGSNQGTIADAYAAGQVSGPGELGGLVGEKFEATETDAYWDVEATGQDSSAGSATGLTTAEMQGTAAPENMPGLDFETVWATQSGEYPVFQTMVPDISGVTLTDDTDGDGVVSDGDTVLVTATVTDENDISTVDTDAGAFDAGTVTLSDDGPASAPGDDQYSATFTVGLSPTEGSQSLTVKATDEFDLVGTGQSNPLTVDTSTPTPTPTPTATPTPTPTATPTPTPTATPTDRPVPAPTARGDEYSVLEGGTLEVTPPGLLANDDPDAGSVEVVGIERPASDGEVLVQTNGALEYIPDDGFNGTDTFVYEVANGDGDTDTATVTVEVVEATASVDTDADIDGDGATDEVELAPVPGQTITGTSNLPAGSELTVRVRGTDSDSPFVEPLSATVDSDGEFSVTGDFGTRSGGTNFSIDVRYDGDSVLDAPVDGRFLAPASASVSNFSAPEQTTLGRTITVEATVANEGDRQGTFAVEYRFDGRAETERTVTLDGGESTRVSFDVTFETPDPATYSHGIAADGDAVADEIVIDDDDPGGGEDPVETSTTVETTSDLSTTTAMETTMTETALDEETDPNLGTTAADGLDQETTTTNGPGPGVLHVIAAIATIVSLVLRRSRGNATGVLLGEDDE